jgi:hypothetical protein
MNKHISDIQSVILVNSMFKLVLLESFYSIVRDVFWNKYQIDAVEERNKDTSL